jgi:mercuric ion transport protein
MTTDPPTEPPSSHGRAALLTGGLAALLASTCCLGPLVLITLGVSGAWISNLTLLEPYQPYFIAAALVALFFASRRLWRPVEACEPGQVCALPQVNRAYKILFWVVVALVVVALGFPLIAHWFY